MVDRTHAAALQDDVGAAVVEGWKLRGWGIEGDLPEHTAGKRKFLGAGLRDRAGKQGKRQREAGASPRAKPRTRIDQPAPSGRCVVRPRNHTGIIREKLFQNLPTR